MRDLDRTPGISRGALLLVVLIWTFALAAVAYAVSLWI